MSSFPHSYFHSPSQGRLLDVLREHFEREKPESSLPPEELLELGSVYVNRRRAQPDQIVKKDDLIKVRLFPRRYDLTKLSFFPRVVFENEGFIVVDKPSPIPTHATADNRKENLIYLLEQHLEKKFYVTSRLDADTEGLLILAKSLEAQSELNQLFRSSRIKKIYRALSKQAPPQGRHLHYQSPEMSPKREFANEPLAQDWKRCELVVLSVREVSQGYLSEIELLTGRTHQIRGQMALLSCPLIGDSIYGDKTGASSLGLECYQLKIPWKDQWIELTRS